MSLIDDFGAAVALSNGTVVAFGGANRGGVLDVPEAARSDVFAVSCGAEHCLALRTDYTVVAW